MARITQRRGRGKSKVISAKQKAREAQQARLDAKITKKRPLRSSDESRLTIDDIDQMFPPRNFRMRAHVKITKPRNSHNGRIAQIVKKSLDGKRYAVRVNYNGQYEVYKDFELTPATAAEKKKDPKMHNRELTMSIADAALYRLN